MFHRQSSKLAYFNTGVLTICVLVNYNQTYDFYSKNADRGCCCSFVVVFLLLLFFVVFFYLGFFATLFPALPIGRHNGTNP